MARSRLKTNKLKDNSHGNYDRTAGLIFRSNIPPIPSDDTADESLTIVAARSSLDKKQGKE